MYTPGEETIIVTRRRFIVDTSRFGYVVNADILDTMTHAGHCYQTDTGKKPASDDWLKCVPEDDNIVFYYDFDRKVDPAVADADRRQAALEREYEEEAEAARRAERMAPYVGPVGM